MSKNYNSINENQLQLQQINHQFTNEALVDSSQHQADLYYKQDNLTNLSQYQSLYNTENLNSNTLFQIFVQIPNGRILSCDINNNEECLKQITEQIYKKEGIPSDRQRLYLGSQFLNQINSKTIKKYQTLHLNINCSNYMVVVYNNQRHIIKADLNDSVSQIKHQLYLQYDYPINSQTLYFKNFQLNDNIKLYYYKIQKHSIIVLKLQNIIYIEQKSKRRQFINYLDINEKVQDLKASLKQQHNDLGDDFHLLYNDVILENENILLSYHITNLSTLQLVEKKFIKFYIETLTTTLLIKKEQYQTINDIKQEIEEQLQYPIDIQHLFYKGKELENNMRIIDYIIKEDSKLFLFNNLTPPFEIIIIDCTTFQDYLIQINLNNKVYELKEKLFQLQLFPKELVLKYNGRTLKDDRDLSYYNIQNFNHIFMEY